MIEEDHALSLRKLVRSTHEGLRSHEVKQGTFANGMGEFLQRYDRMADNGNQFAMNLHTMHEELLELTNNCEKGRKYWKQNGLNAEKRVSDAESLMEKAKAKYDSACEDYVRNVSGDRTSGSKRFNLKSGKLGPQSDEDILKRVETTDNDYATKVQLANSQRQELLTKLRPHAVKALQDLIAEVDSGLTYQLQKFGEFQPCDFLLIYSDS